MRESLSENSGFWKFFLILLLLSGGIVILHRTTSTDNPSLSYCLANPEYFSGKEVWIPDCSVKQAGPSILISTGNLTCKAMDYPLAQTGTVEHAQVRAVFIHDKEPFVKVLQVQTTNNSGSRRTVELVSLIALVGVFLFFLKDFSVEIILTREKNG